MLDESRFIIAMQQESKLKALTEAFRVRNDQDKWNSKHKHESALLVTLLLK